MEKTSAVINYLIVAEVAQAVLLIFILVTMKRNKPANIFYALFIFFISSAFSMTFLSEKGMHSAVIVSALISLPGLSILGVLIWFYTSFITGTTDKFRPSSLIHFLILVPLMLLLLINGGIDPGRPEQPGRSIAIIVLLIGAGLANSFIYIAVSFIRLNIYSSRIREYFSDTGRISMNWLKQVTALSLVILIAWNAQFWLRYFKYDSSNPFWLILDHLLFLAILFITAYNLINQPEIFRKNREMNILLDESSAGKNSGSTKEKYARQNIDENMLKKHMETLTDYMKREKPYLNEEITIKDLADSTGIPSHHISIVINSILNKNFYTFINEYRIQEAIDIMNDAGNADASILSIAFKSGFNSKSTFNSVFKKITGKTPSEYRIFSAQTMNSRTDVPDDPINR